MPSHIEIPEKVTLIIELSIYSTLAIGFHIIETIINPTFFKIGIGNAVILLLIRQKKIKIALFTALLKVFFGSLFSGSLLTPIFISSLFASILSFFIMFLMSKENVFGPVGVSICGSISHNFVLLAFSNLIISGIFSSLWSIFILFSLLSGSITGLIVFLFERKI